VLAICATACLAALLLAPPALPASSRPMSMASLEAGIVREVNGVRAQYGLPALRVNVHLAQAATEHTNEMAADGYFRHNSFNGTPFWQRITQFYGEAGFDYWAVGENLLWSSPGVDPAEAVAWWMQSPPHRANILSKDWREVGVDALYVAGAPGTYHGLDVTLVTLDFGVRHS